MTPFIKIIIVLLMLLSEKANTTPTLNCIFKYDVCSYLLKHDLVRRMKDITINTK